MKMASVFLLALILNANSFSVTDETLNVRLRIALVQFDSVPGENERNIREMERLVRKAAGDRADFIMFHEVAVTDYVDDVSLAAEAVPGGPSCTRMEELARELNVYIAYGTSEKTPENRHFITYVFVGPEGYFYKYRKTWLWRDQTDEGFRNEWARFDPGTGPETFDFKGLKATCFICADGESPRCIARAGATRPDLVFYPNNRSSYVADNKSFQERAKQIGATMLVTNRVGMSWKYRCKGGLAVISPEGELLAQSDPAGNEEILVYDLSVPRRNH
jgi:omega-amidase